MTTKVYSELTKSPFRPILITACFLAALVMVAFAFIGPREIFRNLYISLTEDTVYSAGYSEVAFQEIEIGDAEAIVNSSLGVPLYEAGQVPYIKWLYTPDREPIEAFETEEKYPDTRYSYTVVTFGEEGNFMGAHGQLSHRSSSSPGGVSSGATIFGNGVNTLALTDADIAELKELGATTESVADRFGKPQAEFDSRVVKWLTYSRSPGSKNYRKRKIGLDENGKVCRKVSEVWWD